MGLPHLDNLVRVRQLKAETATQEELNGLVRSGNARVNLPPEQWRVLDQAHRKRNVAEYEGHLDVDRALVEALIRVGQEVATRVAALGPLPSGASKSAGK